MENDQSDVLRLSNGSYAYIGIMRQLMEEGAVIVLCGRRVSSIFKTLWGGHIDKIVRRGVISLNFAMTYVGATKINQSISRAY